MYTCSCRKAIKNLSFLLIQWTEILLHYMVRLGQNLHLLLTCTYVDMYNLVGENWGLEKSAFFYLCMSLFSAPIFFCRFWSQYDLWFQSKNQIPFWFSVFDCRRMCRATHSLDYENVVMIAGFIEIA